MSGNSDKGALLRTAFLISVYWPLSGHRRHQSQTWNYVIAWLF